MAFSKNGDLLAVASGNITVYRVATQSVYSLIHVNMPVSHMTFSPDEKRLDVIAEGSSSFVRSANSLEVRDLIEAACSRLTRNLSVEEWDRYFGLERYRETCPVLMNSEVTAKRPRGLAARPGDGSDDEE